MVCEGAFVVTDLSGEKWRWCRVAGQIRVFSEERMNDWRRGFFEHISMPANDYAFRLADPSGTEIYAEEGRLRDHFTYLWHKGRGVGYNFFGVSSSKGEGWGKFALLEFLPPGPGEYRFSFRAVAVDERAAEAYRNLSDIVDLEIFVKQGVMPITQRMYFHKKLDLTAKSPFSRGRAV